MAGLIRRTGLFTSFRRFIVICEVLLVPHLSKAADSSRPITTEMSWWDARTHCKDEYNSDLFIPDVVISGENPFNLEQNKYYWVGAMETSQWRWTDNTPLYEHVGYVFIDDDFEKSADLPGNCVTECYNHCNSANGIYHYIGLSGSACYCLIPDKSKTLRSGGVALKPCPGNSEEKCGNNTVMTVYKTEEILDIKHDQHQCAYAWKFSNHLYLSTEYCNKRKLSLCYDDGKESGYHCQVHSWKYFRCGGDFCASCSQASWQFSNRSCSFVKVTSGNEEGIFNFIYEDISYWVGLHKTVTQKWNNKTLVNRSYSTSARDGQKCLALFYKDLTGLKAVWRPCNEEHSALCSNNEYNTAPPGTPSTPENLVTTYAENVTSPDVNNHNTKSATRDKMDIVEDNNHGIYIGVGIGVLMMLALFFGLTLFFKRQGRFCFQKKENKSIIFRTAAENITYDVPQTTVINSTVAESGHTLYQNEATGIPETISEYASVRETIGSGSKNEIKSNISEANDDYESTYTNPQQVSEEQSNCYHHLGVGNEDEYDIAGSRSESDIRDSTYNHVDSTDVKKEKQVLSSENGDEEDSADYYNIVSTSTGGHSNIGHIP